MKTVTLNNGVEMPVLGFGVYQVPDDETEHVVAQALDAGYRAIDTAASYQNEAAVGRAIAGSGIARDELFVTTKLWMEHAGDEATPAAFYRSLDRLGLDYVDLYLIHQPFNDYYGAWRAMEKLLEQGRVRAIGVSNFFPDRLADLIAHNDVTPAVNQIETHVYYQRGFDHQVMAEYGVRHESWGPFAEGRNNMFTDPGLSAIGEALGKSVGQVVLRWLIQREVIVIPKSVRPERMRENLDVFDFELTAAQMEQIAAMDTNTSLFFDHRDPAIARDFAKRHIDV
ncbi:aldo/keto reductase [Mycobacterium sp. Y57]|uniref:aldo/keto reductase n=1 Tax=Mycolicibacterium xanthum TaxID=2796469 RepID=UPI001C844553|nr:aldo/keto reductase [Mycolicibacterium xanthum]MBX7435205.1 aldo/keto reductase [Mycolicibacterium xanthum]